MTARPFGLRDNPFAEGYDRRLVYPHRTHRENVDRLARAIAQRAPFVLLTGPDGAGKTTTLTTVLAAAGGVTRIELAAADALDASEVRRRVLEALEPGDASAPLATRLQARDPAAPVLALAIDEAEKLSDAVLAELHALAGVENSGGAALTVVLAGSTALEARLDAHEGIRPRIAARGRIEPMSARETESFLHHRVSVCGGPGALFPRATCRAIHEHARGVAREVRVLAGAAMRHAAAAGAPAVETAHVSAAAAGLGIASALPSEPKPAPVAASAPPQAAERAPKPATMQAPEAATETLGPAVPNVPRLPRTVASRPAPAPASVTATPEPAPASAPIPASRPAPAPTEDETAPPPIVRTPQVEAWLARFHDPGGPPRIGSRVAVDDSTTELAHPTIPHPTPIRSIPADTDTTEVAEADAAPPPPRTRPRRGRVVGRGPLKPSRHARRPPGAAWATAAVAVIAIAGLAWRHHGDLLARLPKLGHARATQVAATQAPAPTQPEAASPSRTPARPAPAYAARTAAISSPVTVTPLPPARPSATPRTSASPQSVTAGHSGETLVATSPAPPAKVTPGNATVERHYRVIVGSYLVSDRAHEERDRVAGLTPFPCKVLKGHEDGAEIFRVLVGPFATRQEAEAASEQLTATGSVNEARVVGWFGPKAPRD